MPCRLVDTVDRPPSDCCRCRTGCDDHVTMACTSDRHQLTRELLITPPPIAQRSIVMSVSVCLSVCLSVCGFVCVCLSAIISSDLHVRSSPVGFVHVTYGRGSVLLWRCSDMLCTSGFMDDVIFAHKPRLLDVAAVFTQPWAWL